MKFAVVVFPGSNCDHDCYYALKDVMKQDVVMVWHKDRDVQGAECVVLPGGFSYGDYLRTGAIARFSPIMDAVIKHAGQGRPVIGICNGFQILLEVGLLPGAMKRNKNLHFMCRYVSLKVENVETLFTHRCVAGEILRVPIAHGEGNYYADNATLKSLQDHDQIVLTYCDQYGRGHDDANPNGSSLRIAGICSRQKNVLGMMPHPERCVEEAMGSVDGRVLFESIIMSAVNERLV